MTGTGYGHLNPNVFEIATDSFFAAAIICNSINSINKIHT